MLCSLCCPEYPFLMQDVGSFRVAQGCQATYMYCTYISSTNEHAFCLLDYFYLHIRISSGSQIICIYTRIFCLPGYLYLHTYLLFTRLFVFPTHTCILSTRLFVFTHVYSVYQIIFISTHILSPRLFSSAYILSPR